MHKRISYYFLADLRITRHARETESEKRIPEAHPEYSKQNCSVELVISRNRNYRPYAISEHSFFCPGKAKHGRIRLNSIISRGKN